MRVSNELTKRIYGQDPGSSPNMFGKGTVTIRMRNATIKKLKPNFRFIKTSSLRYEVSVVAD